MKKTQYIPPKIQVFTNGAIVTTEKNTSGLESNGGSNGPRDGWSKTAKTRCTKFALGIPHRDFEREGDQAYAVTLKLPSKNRWSARGRNPKITGPITGQQFKKTLKKMLDNLIPKSGQPCTSSRPWKRVFWVIELRINGATPHIHALVWTDQAEEDLINSTQRQWVSLWNKCNVKATAKHVYIKHPYDVNGWLEYMLKRNAPANKKAQQECLKYLTGIGNVWGYRPKNLFSSNSPYEVDLNKHQMYRVRRILHRFEIRQEELRQSGQENKEKIAYLRRTLKCSYLNNVNVSESGPLVDELKMRRSRAYSLTSFGFDEDLVKRLIDYIRLADIRNEEE